VVCFYFYALTLTRIPTPTLTPLPLPLPFPLSLSLPLSVKFSSLHSAVSAPCRLELVRELMFVGSYSSMGRRGVEVRPRRAWNRKDGCVEASARTFTCT
jgi:hypothetical protein